MVELGDVPVYSLVPEPLREIASADEFMAALPQYDADMATRLEEASAAGECLRFVGARRSLSSLASASYHTNDFFCKQVSHLHRRNWSLLWWAAGLVESLGLACM